jgi:hypothetical protein
MSSRSRALALGASACARVIAASAAAPAASSIGALMFGPSTSASPQWHIAQSGSRRCAWRNARAASAWLNA